MSDEKQASGTPAPAAAETQTPATGDQSQDGGQSAVAQAAEVVTDQQKKLNDTLAERGRELKAERTRAAKLESDLAEAKAKNEELWYKHPDTPEEAKAAFRAERERAAKEGPKVQQLQNRATISEAIADEENPAVRAALKSLRSKAEASGRYPDADTIAAIRESLTPGDGDGAKVDDETPPNVSASRTTRSAAGPSIDEQIKEVEAAIKAGKTSYERSGLLGLRQKKAMEQAGIARG